MVDRCPSFERHSSICALHFSKLRRKGLSSISVYSLSFKPTWLPSDFNSKYQVCDFIKTKHFIEIHQFNSLVIYLKINVLMLVIKSL
jgi:hypothetical protein